MMFSYEIKGSIWVAKRAVYLCYKLGFNIQKWVMTDAALCPEFQGQMRTNHTHSVITELSFELLVINKDNKDLFTTLQISLFLQSFLVWWQTVALGPTFHQL